MEMLTLIAKGFALVVNVVADLMSILKGAGGPGAVQRAWAVTAAVLLASFLSLSLVPVNGSSAMGNGAAIATQLTATSSGSETLRELLERLRYDGLSSAVDHGLLLDLTRMLNPECRAQALARGTGDVIGIEASVDLIQRRWEVFEASTPRRPFDEILKWRVLGECAYALVKSSPLIENGRLRRLSLYAMTRLYGEILLNDARQIELPEERAALSVVLARIGELGWTGVGKEFADRGQAVLRVRRSGLATAVKTFRDSYERRRATVP